MNTTKKLEVYLAVDHPELSVIDLEVLLDSVPDECWNVGQGYTPSPRADEQYYQFSRWALREKVNSLDELDEAISKLVERIKKIEYKFDLLPQDSVVSLILFATETDTILGIGFNAKIIKLLAQIKAGIEISLVVSP